MSRIVHGNHPLNVPKDQPMRIGHEQVGYFTYPDIIREMNATIFWKVS